MNSSRYGIRSTSPDPSSSQTKRFGLKNRPPSKAYWCLREDGLTLYSSKSDTTNVNTTFAWQSMWFFHHYMLFMLNLIYPNAISLSLPTLASFSCSHCYICFKGGPLHFPPEIVFTLKIEKINKINKNYDRIIKNKNKNKITSL